MKYDVTYTNNDYEPLRLTITQTIKGALLMCDIPYLEAEANEIPEHKAYGPWKYKTHKPC